MKKEFEIFNDLNKEQRAAVEYNEGPQLILAGAGSGKTRTLTHKIAYLCKMGIKPENILAITFTNKAAGEMKERIENLVINSKRITACTFHSLCNKMIRSNPEKLGFDKKYSIYTESSQVKLLKEIVEDLGYTDSSIYKIKSEISLLKNNMVTPKLMEMQLETVDQDELFTIYKEYNKRLKINNALDFDDLLLYNLELLENKEILTKWKNRYTHIFVDEFQDTNKPQFKLVTMLADKNICVVGDDNQAIYGWRGSDIKYIVKFNEYFPLAKSYLLETNYRSTPTILNAASKIIELNKFKTNKKIKAHRKNNKYKINLMNCINEYDEATSIVAEVKNLLDIYEPKDIAILYRTNAQSKVIEDVMVEMALPYKVIGGLNFYDRKEVKDIVAFLSLINNPKDNVAFNRIVNFPPRGIGKKAQTEVRLINEERNIPLLEAASLCSDKLVEFRNNILLCQDYYNKTKSVSKTIEYILKLFKIYEYWDNIIESSDIDRNENISELYRTTKNNKDITLNEFLNDIILLSSKNNKDNDNYITLMTAHASKGLEYPVIFVTGLMEDLFPLPVKTHKELEEERRLFYVALTRAMDLAYLTYSQSRYKFGKLNYYFKSHFIENIPDKFLKEVRA